MKCHSPRCCNISANFILSQWFCARLSAYSVVNIPQFEEKNDWYTDEVAIVMVMLIKLLLRFWGYDEVALFHLNFFVARRSWPVLCFVGFVVSHLEIKILRWLRRFLVLVAVLRLEICFNFTRKLQ